MQRTECGIKHYMQANGTRKYFHCTNPLLHDTIVVFHECVLEKFHSESRILRILH